MVRGQLAGKRERQFAGTIPEQPATPDAERAQRASKRPHLDGTADWAVARLSLYHTVFTEKYAKH